MRASIIDRVDDDDIPVEEISRAEALDKGANFRTVHVFVFDSHGALLLQRLAPLRERHAGRWGSSIAAHLHAGESYREAAVRRLGEELGLRRPLQRIGKTALREGRGTKFVELYTTYDGAAQIGEPDHISDLRFWPMGQLPAAISTQPEHFTPTLRHLVRFYLGAHGSPGRDH